MPTVDPKPHHRLFRRVLYREDSKDSTIIKDVSPRNDGHLIKQLKKSNRNIIEDDHIMRMTHASRILLIREGFIYKSPVERIQYIKRIRNNPMSRYLFHMKKYTIPNLDQRIHRKNHNSL